MTPEQRYLFDVTGYLHVQGAVTGEALEQAQEAADRYIFCPPDERPPGFQTRPREMKVDDLGNLPLIRYEHGFAFNKALEAIAIHPAIWPLVKECTADKPRLVSGTLSFQSHDANREPVEQNPAGLHCARDGRYWLTRYQVKDGRIFCNDLVCFFYLTDVEPGDGGLIVVPGSHKSEFERPDDLLTPGPDHVDPAPDPVFTNLTPKAGDYLFCSELLTHGVLQWKPKDRDRRFLILRYKPQFEGRASLPQEIIERLAPETQELIESAGYGHTKKIVKTDEVMLTA